MSLKKLKHEEKTISDSPYIFLNRFFHIFHRLTKRRSRADRLLTSPICSVTSLRFLFALVLGIVGLTGIFATTNSDEACASICSSDSGDPILPRTLNFNANGGSGAPDSISCMPGCYAVSCSVIIPSTTLTRSGYTFLGWSKSSTATSADYQADDSITMTEEEQGSARSTTLYAVWQEDTPDPSTLTLNIQNPTLSLDLIPNYSTGTFAKSGNSTISVTTNNFSGYALSIKANSNSNLINGSNTIATLSPGTSITESTFSSSSGTDYNNKWGILPSKYASSANTTYRPAPGTSGQEIDTTSSANSSANTYTLSIGARVDQNTAPGTYTNTFVVTAVANLINYSITFNANAGSDTVTNMPSPNPYTGSTNTTTINLPNTVPARDGYNFKGWCSVATSDSTCSGTTYNPDGGGTNLTYAIDQTGANTTTLYAMWESAIAGNMQMWLGCGSLSEGQSVILLDTRDNNDYSVKKINGDCWMTQNLRYLGDTGSAAKTMTIGNYNSNVSNKSIALYSLNSSDAGNFNAYSNHCDGNGYNYACVYNSGNATTGVWYNYYAATAGTISTNSNSTAATQDICPAGWHLPSGPNTTSGTDFNKLVGSQNPTAGTTAFGAVAGGVYGNGSLSDTGVGYWWSATANNTTTRYRLYYDSSTEKFRGNVYSLRYFGNFVRCVSSYPDVQTPPNVTYMQDFASMSADELNTTENAMTTNTDYTAVDKRDGQFYTIKKLGNSNIWMAKNLAIGCAGTGNTYSATIGSKALTSADSNVSSSWSTPTALLSTAANSSSSSGYTTAAMQCNATYGGYYNYAAATAGTITGSSNNTGATNDICPAGWRLPTNSEQSGITGATSVLSPVYSGYYTNGSLVSTGSSGSGYWWSATASNTINRYLLYYYSGSLLTGNSNRYLGSSVRCILPTASTSTYTIAYNANGGSGSMSNQTARIGTNTNTVLKKNTFTRDGYVFAGWNTQANGSGTGYVDEAGVRDLASAGGTVTLYAQWARGYMQQYTLSQCQADASSSDVLLQDSRDGKTYTARFINGLCWMTKDLQIINNTGNATGVISAAGSNFTGANISLSNSVTFSTFSASYYTVDGAIWYSFCAAAAKTSGSCQYGGTYYGSSDICPAGWHIPTKDEYSGILGYASVFNLTTRGYRYNGGNSMTGYGYYWSATANGTNQYYMYGNESAPIGISSGISNVSGMFVRCVRSS